MLFYKNFNKIVLSWFIFYNVENKNINKINKKIIK